MVELINTSGSGAVSTGSSIDTTSSSSTSNNVQVSTFVGDVVTTSTSSPELFIGGANSPSLTNPNLLTILNTITDATITNTTGLYEQDTALAQLIADCSSMYNDIANSVFTENQLTIANQALLDDITDTANSQIDDMNTKIDSLNGTNDENVTNDNSENAALIAATQALNHAYQTYINSSQSDDDKSAYQDAIDAYNSVASSYNSYATSRNSQISDFNGDIDTFNSEVADNNEQIDQINGATEEDSFPTSDPTNNPNGYISQLALAPTASMSTQPLAVPAALNESAVSELTEMDYNNITSNGGGGGYQTAFGGVYADDTAVAALTLLTLATSTGTSLDKALDDKSGNLPGKIRNIPAAYRSQVATGSTSSNGAATNSGFGAILLATDPAIATFVLSQAGRSAAYTNFLNRFSNDPSAINKLVNAHNTLGTSLIASAINIGQQFNTLSADDPTIRAALSISNAVNTTAFLNTTSSSTPITDTEAFAVLLLAGNALSQLANATGNTTLIANILSDAGFSAADINTILGNGATVNTVNTAAGGVNDSATINSTTTTGTDDAVLTRNSNTRYATVNSNTPNDDNQVTTNNNSTSDSTLTPAQQQFQDQLTQSLVTNGGLTNQQAAVVAAAVTSDTTNNTTNILASGLTYNNRDNRSNSLADIGSQATNSYTRNLQEVNEQTKRDALVSELEKQGLSSTQATKVASGVSLNPLTFSSKTSTREDLVATLQGTYTRFIPAREANRLAQRQADALVGPANTTAAANHDESHETLVSITNKSLKVTRNQQDQNLFDAGVEAFKASFTPPTEGYKNVEKITDPATRVAQTFALQNNPGSASGGPVKIGGTHQALDVQV